MEIDFSRGDAETRRVSDSSPAQRGRGTMRAKHARACSQSMVEGARASASLPAFGGTPPAARGESQCSAPPRLRVQCSDKAEQIVEIARSWIGTPYVHQASVKQVGCDCLGLLRGIWRELYGEEPEEVPPYSLDWAEATGAETLYIALRRHAREIGLARLAPGDIALFRMASRGPAKHCGVIGSRQSAFGSRNLSSYDCRLPAADCHLTLIHARQNKRVSEEPLSPFWRSRLAFAFRL